MFKFIIIIILALLIGCAKFETINRADELSYEIKTFSAIDTINFINESIKKI